MAVAAIRKHGGFGLFYEQRTGKTRTAIEVARRLGARRVLVVCPDKVRGVWAEQVERFWPEAPDVVMVDGPLVKRAARLVNRDPMVAVVSYETGWRTSLLEALHWDLVIWDEAHKLKQGSGKASRWAGRLAAVVPARLGLSGTPTPHGPEDAWAVYRALFPGKPLGSRTLTEYRSRWLRPAEMAEWRDRDVVFTKRGADLVRWKWRDLDELHRRMYWHEDGTPAASRVLAADVVDMPEVVEEVLSVELEPAARRLYRELETEMIADLGGGEAVTAANAMVLVLRLSQLTGGTLRSEDGVLSRVSEAKESALAEYLEEAGGEPVVVFCRFHSDLDAVHRAAETAGVGSLELSGRRNELERWQGSQDGENPVLAVQVEAGGVGVSLVRARLLCWYSLGYSLGSFLQARARVLGPEQKRPVSMTALVARGTVDEDVWAALAARQSVVDRLVERFNS